MAEDKPSSLCAALEQELRHRRLSGKSQPYTGMRCENFSSYFRATTKLDLPPQEKAIKMAGVIRDAHARGYWINDYLDTFKAFCKEHEL